MTTALYTELTTGPLAAQIAPYLASGDDGIIHVILTTKNISVTGDISANDFADWSAATGLRAVIQDRANTPGDPLRSSALALLDLLQGNLQQTLRLSKPALQALFQAWVTTGAITQAQHDSLITLAQTNISRADQLPGIDVSIPAIAAARTGG